MAETVGHECAAENVGVRNRRNREERKAETGGVFLWLYVYVDSFD